MKSIFVLGKHESKEMLKNPGTLAVLFLPILMSKMILTTIKVSGADFLLLSIWILFAQVLIGIMLTGPTVIEERETKTIDALLCSPLTFRGIVWAKGGIILISSLIVQIIVALINEKFAIHLISLLLPMIIGGIVFIEIGMIIGLTVKSSQSGSALSSVVMISLFLIVALYQVLPKWTYNFLILLPSIEVTEVMQKILDGRDLICMEMLLLIVWMFVLGFIIKKIGDRY